MSKQVTEVPDHEAAAGPADGRADAVTAGAVTAAAPEPGTVSPPFRYGADIAGEIELRWQDRWDVRRAPSAPPTRPARCLTDSRPWPAGRSATCWTCSPTPAVSASTWATRIGYIATDVYARYLRMTGHHVLHTMGFDAFGLPAEQYALTTGQHPQVTTRQNVDNMRRQLRRLGMGYDNRRSVETTDPAFYRWTQWIFLQMFSSWVDERTGTARPIDELVAEYASGQRPVPGGHRWDDLSPAEQRELVDDHRLAYIADEPVNWCPGLGTVLANEEVTADGRSDIGNFPVYRRPMRQWMMRITAMAQRLIDDLEPLAWPENVKSLQRNWIGASDGANIWLPMADPADGASRGLHHPARYPARRHLCRACTRASAGRHLRRRCLAGGDARALAW